ncbi:MAG: type II toxin-antitoxin system prevent-host-death family antitoxin [Acidobacteria bacterium]|nr:type II toxin-antitoxin system prevent-host-death family antitoxin [Acidobacteriota bacterium]
MRTAASIADVKARLSEFVRRVKAGNEVVITDRGVPVARLHTRHRPGCLSARLRSHHRP